MKNRTQLTAVAILLILLSIGPTMFARSSTISLQASNYVTGKVTSASGRAAPSVWVIMKQNGHEKGRSLTGDDGSYYIGNLSDGEYEIVFTRGTGHLSNRVTLPQNRVFNIRIDF